MNDLLQNPPVQIGAWLACLFFTVMLAYQLIKLWAALRGRPAPGELSERITKVESAQTDHARRLKALERNDQTLRDIVDANNQTLRDLILTENAKIYNRINEVAKGFYTLNGKVDALLSREHRTRTDNEDHA